MTRCECELTSALSSLIIARAKINLPNDEAQLYSRREDLDSQGRFDREYKKLSEPEVRENDVSRCALTVSVSRDSVILFYICNLHSVLRERVSRYIYTLPQLLTPLIYLHFTSTLCVHTARELFYVLRIRSLNSLADRQGRVIARFVVRTFPRENVLLWIM